VQPMGLKTLDEASSSLSGSLVPELPPTPWKKLLTKTRPLIMGNAHSDASERQAHDVIKWVPIIGPVYSGVRAAVYAGKGDGQEAHRSGVAMGVGVLETATCFV
jgi:hypothetical protein